MEGNIEKHIKQKLQQREIQPSESAWERLVSQLEDAEVKKKRHWFFYVGYAASILLLASLFVFLIQNNQDKTILEKEVIVKEEIPEPIINSMEDFIKNPKEVIEIVDQKTQLEMVPNTLKTLPKKDTEPNRDLLESVIAQEVLSENDSIDVQEKIKEFVQKEDTRMVFTDSIEKQPKSNTGIYVDSDALLLSVTGTREELKAYYKKYKIDRQDVLLAIKKELKKSNLRVDPESILAEVELDVNEENFQNNFYQFIKKRVSTVATAIANRNN